MDQDRQVVVVASYRRTGVDLGRETVGAEPTEDVAWRAHPQVDGRRGGGDHQASRYVDGLYRNGEGRKVAAFRISLIEGNKVEQHRQCDGENRPAYIDVERETHVSLIRKDELSMGPPLQAASDSESSRFSGVSRGFSARGGRGRRRCGRGRCADPRPLVLR